MVLSLERYRNTEMHNEYAQSCMVVYCSYCLPSLIPSAPSASCIEKIGEPGDECVCECVRDACLASLHIIFMAISLSITLMCAQDEWSNTPQVRSCQYPVITQ